MGNQIGVQVNLSNNQHLVIIAEVNNARKIQVKRICHLLRNISLHTNEIVLDLTLVPHQLVVVTMATIEICFTTEYVIITRITIVVIIIIVIITIITGSISVMVVIIIKRRTTAIIIIKNTLIYIKHNYVIHLKNLVNVSMATIVNMHMVNTNSETNRRLYNHQHIKQYVAKIIGVKIVFVHMVINANLYTKKQLVLMQIK